MKKNIYVEDITKQYYLGQKQIGGVIGITEGAIYERKRNHTPFSLGELFHLKNFIAFNSEEICSLIEDAIAIETGGHK